MKKILSLFLFLSFGVSAQSVRLEVDSNIYAGNGKEHLMVVELGKEDATTSENAHKVYIPMRDSMVKDGELTVNNLDFTVLFPTDTVPWYSDTNSLNNSVVKQTLRVSTPEDLGPWYLYAGFLKSDKSGLIVISPSSARELSGNQGVVTFSYYVNIHALCSISDAGCLPIAYGSDDVQRHVIEPIIYFFLSKTKPEDILSTDLKVSDAPDGSYFKYSLSNFVDLGDGLAVLDSLLKGDARLTVNYGGKKIGQMKDVIGVVYKNGPNPEQGDDDADDWPQQNITEALDVGGSLGSKDNGIDVPGRFFVKNLKNDKRYWVGVAFINKWYFSTFVSKTRNEMPEEIESFLEDKACYLISAGFKKEHYVLEFFRSFRDRILLKSSWGKRFVNVYYSTAPKYAQIIWHNEFLSGMVRFFAFTFYFLMRYFPAIALAILAGVLIRKLWPIFR